MKKNKELNQDLVLVFKNNDHNLFSCALIYNEHAANGNMKWYLQKRDFKQVPDTILRNPNAEEFYHPYELITTPGECLSFPRGQLGYRAVHILMPKEFNKIHPELAGSAFGKMYCKLGSIIDGHANIIEGYKRSSEQMAQLSKDNFGAVITQNFLNKMLTLLMSARKIEEKARGEEPTSGTKKSTIVTSQKKI